MLKIFPFVILLVILSSCSESLMNLSDAKLAVKDYYESGRYNDEMNLLVSRIQADFSQYDFSENDAVVFDVDETTLSNYRYIKSIDFGYEKDLWENYLLEASAEPIPSTKKLIDWFNDRNVKIIFITGRSVESYEATKRNLINSGITIFDTLICKAPEFRGKPASAFKSFERSRLVDKGYNIIGCFGDLQSDLEGGFTGKTYKFPNYLYNF